MLMNMKELLAVANENYFAVPAFNISDYNMFNGIMEASEEKNSPVIIAIHPDELSHIEPEMVQGIRARIHKSPVPAVIHLDHGASFQQVMEAIRAGKADLAERLANEHMKKAYDNMVKNGLYDIYKNS